VSRATQKARMAIPIKLRKNPGIHRGTPVIFPEENGRLILRPITQKLSRSCVGSRLLRERRRKN